MDNGQNKAKTGFHFKIDRKQVQEWYKMRTREA